MSTKKLSVSIIVGVVAMLTLLATPVRAPAAEAWPSVDEPPKADVQWVARSMLVNGVPTSVMQFQSPLSAADIVTWYKNRWSSGYDHAPAVHTVAYSTVVGQMRGSYLMTVQVSEGARGGSQGMISVAQVLGSKVDRSPGVVPLISGAHVVSVVESQDLGQYSRQVLILASQSPQSVADFYQAALTNAGWQAVQSSVAAPPGNVAHTTATSGSFLAFSQGDTQIQMSIAGAQSGHGTSVLANVVTKGTGAAED